MTREQQIQKAWMQLSAQERAWHKVYMHMNGVLFARIKILERKLGWE